MPAAPLRTALRRRLFSAAAVAKPSGSQPPAPQEKIVASVVLERPPLLLPKIHPAVYAFQEFSFRWRQQHCRQYPTEFLSRERGEPPIKFTPVQRVTDANKTNDQKSLQRALDNKLYLLVYGKSFGSLDDKPIWHFPDKLYGNEDSLRLCAESALKSVLRGLEHAHFMGNAPVAHMVVPKEGSANTASLKQFFFKAQIIGADKLEIGKCKDYVWVTKEELLTYFPEHSSFFDKMIVHTI